MQTKNIYNELIELLKAQTQLTQQAIRLAQSHKADQKEMIQFAQEQLEGLEDKGDLTIVEQGYKRGLERILLGRVEKESSKAIEDNEEPSLNS